MPQGTGVIRADRSRGIPLPDGSSDVIYHSAVLEHIRREHVPGFLRECRRLLKPGGVIRVAVPDLEQICRLYLEKLVADRLGDTAAVADRDWMVLEMLGHSVRETSDGAILNFLRQPSLPNESFVLGRIGTEGRGMMEKIRMFPVRATGAKLVRKLGRQWRRALQLAGRALAGLFLGASGRQALRVGAFRFGSEVHQWVYDDHSLASVLASVGFAEPKRQGASASRIPGWASFHLDTLPDGSVRKLDLFYVEAVNPS